MSDEVVNRTTSLMMAFYEAMDDLGERDKKIVENACCAFLASQIKTDYPNNPIEQDRIIEKYAAHIRATLVHNGVRQTS